ncbi:MAG: hypothetical protein RL177_326 [Bacteroidota bacterium]
MKPFIWSESFHVRAFESDKEGYATIAGILNHLQEAAGSHAGMLGLSVVQLLPQGLTWVLSRIIVTMHRYPVYRDRVRLETWPAGVDRFMALRDFELFGSDESLIASVRTQWVMVDLATMRPVALPQNVHEIASANTRFAMPLESPRVSKLDGDGEFAKSFSVRRSDIDLNKHVNNVNYLIWALEAVPDEVAAHQRPYEVDLVFRNETHYGDEIISRCSAIEGDGTMFQHRIDRKSDGKEVFLAVTRWR